MMSTYFILILAILDRCIFLSLNDRNSFTSAARQAVLHEASRLTDAGCTSLDNSSTDDLGALHVVCL